MNLALAIKNVINKFRNNGNQDFVENESGIIIPEWLQKRKVDDSDSLYLKDFFKTFDISFFSEITADLINEYGNKNYESVIKLCNLLGLYGVKFLGRSATKYSPNSINLDLIVKSNDSLESIYNLKFTNSQIDIILNRENENKIFNFLKSENITIIKQLNGIHLGVMSDKTGIDIYLLANLFKNSGLQVIENPYEYNQNNLSSEEDSITNVETKVITTSIESKKYLDFYHIFSARTENILKNNNVNNIEQLKNLTEEKILSFKNAGYKTAQEILEKINSEELNELYEEEKKLRGFNISVDFESSIEYPKSYAIKDLNVSTRTFNILRANNINTINDLIKLSESQILEFKNSGNGTLNDIKNSLKSLNLFLNCKNNASYTFNEQQSEEIIIDKETFNKPFRELILENRVINSLKKSEIIIIGDIIDFTESDLAKIDGLGANALKELKKVLKDYGIDLNNKYVVAENSLDDRYFYNLFETDLSDEAKNLFKKFQIKNVGQLIEIFPDEIYRDDECCINPNILNLENEIKEYLKKLGFEHYPIKFSKIQKAKLNEPNLKEILELNLHDLLTQKINKFESKYTNVLDDTRKIIYYERIKPGNKFSKTLEELGIKINVSRERIRQIEKNEISKIEILVDETLSIFNVIFDKLFNEFGNLIYFEKNSEIINFEGIIGKFINENDFFHFKICPENNIILSKTIDIEELYNTAIENISSKNSDVIDENTLQSDIEILLLDYLNNKFPQNNNFTLIKNIIINNLLKNYFIKLNETNYKLKCGTRKKSNLTEKVIYFYKTLYPNGEFLYLNFDKIEFELKKHIPELEKHSSRAIQGRMLHCGDLILWGKGFYIHKDNINPNWKIVDDTINRAISLFDNGINDFKIDKLYYEREQDFINANIPDARALYSLLRLKNNPRLILEEWPRVCDANIGRDKRDLIDVFTDYIKDKGSIIPKEEIIRYFCEDRGWKNFQLELIYGRSEKVIRINDGYIHIDNLSCNFDELEKIVDLTKQKIESTGNIIHLRKIKEDYSATWYSVCQRDISYDLMGLLLCKKGDLPFKIDRKVYAKPLCQEENETSQEITFVDLISEWILEQSSENKHVTNKEIYEYCEKQGFNSWNAINSVRKAGILEYYESSFVHPEIIGYSDEMLESVIEIAKQAAKITYKEKLPYIKFELILKQFKNDLPTLNDNYEWTKELLASLLSKINSLEVFNGAFIFRENPFNVEDLDDVSAFLIARNFVNGICKYKQLEKILTQEDIIKYKTINNYKGELFAEGSSIELVDDGNNVVLSKIGRERYLNV